MSVQEDGCRCAQEQKAEQERIAALVEDVPARGTELLPLLQRIQADLGYISKEAIDQVAEQLGLSIMDVYGVASFYNQFKFNKPGKHSVKVCTGTACHVKGGGLVLDTWIKELGIAPGETMPDGEFDLDTVACVGCCGLAPVVLVDDHAVGMMRSADVEDSIRKLRYADEQEA